PGAAHQRDDARPTCQPDAAAPDGHGRPFPGWQGPRAAAHRRNGPPGHGRARALSRIGDRDARARRSSEPGAATLRRRPPRRGITRVTIPPGVEGRNSPPSLLRGATVVRVAGFPAWAG